MCGINGFITTPKHANSIDGVLNTMNTRILHRGPDDDGCFTHKSEHYALGLGMRRLAIIDLNTGAQPMYSDNQDIVIVFNGEIYNYKSLRRNLEEKGIAFNTTSDTEVVLKLYENQGISALKQLDGMFGLSIFDKQQNKVFIARDTFGEKPLYYYNTGAGFYFASELKSIIEVIDHKPEVCKTGLNIFFKLTYIPAPHTIYNNIKKLPANHFISYDLNTFEYSITPIENFNFKQQNITYNEAKKQTKALVLESIESRAIADVPLGTFLSGGVDSSIVSLGLSQLKSTAIDTFSIGFNNSSFNETDKSQLVAKLINSNHHEFIIDENTLQDYLDAIILNFDEPFADSSALPSFIVAKETSSSIKVALTGDGGDEIFGGYNKYLIGNINKRYTKLVPKWLHNGISPIINTITNTSTDNRGLQFKLKKAYNAISYDNDFYWNIIALGFTNNNQLLNSDYYISTVLDEYKTQFKSSVSSLHQFRLVDSILSLEGDMLVKVDRTSMLNSLECRAPFLNKKLWAFSHSLPEDYLLNKRDKKHILKAAFKDDFPEGFLDKSKQGFTVPVGNWLRQSLKEELLSYTDISKLNKQGIFNVDYITNLVQHHITGKADNTYKVWTFYVFQKWYYNTYN